MARYGAPELLSSPGGDTDTSVRLVHAWRALLFELLTGERLVRANGPGCNRPRAACRRLSQGFRSAPDLPGGLSEFLVRALQLEPGARPPLHRMVRGDEDVWRPASSATGGEPG